jgi:hypothetical protein
VRFNVQVPEATEQGVYANWLAIWSTAYEFTFDFGVTLPAGPAVDSDGNPVTLVPTKVVARVKLPPAVIFDFIRATNGAMTNYEQQFGDIKRFGEDPPMYPPDDQPPTGGS